VSERLPLRRLTVRRGSRRFEFPPGSGRAAYYSPEEVDFLRPLWEEGLRHPRLGPVRHERERELMFLHELKVVFGIDLVADQVA
jgi:hypothetical protein